MYIKVLKLNYKLIIIFTIMILILTSTFIFYSVKATQTDIIKVPIIMYHSILKSKTGTYIINPDELEKDLQYIKNNNYTTITMLDLINYVYNDTPLPEKPIIITFDDGFYNNLTYAVPLLEKYNMVAVISVVGTFTDCYSNSGEANPNYGYLRWEDINNLIDSGTIEFQNHTYQLHSTSGSRNGCMKKKHESVSAYTDVLYNDLYNLQQKFQQNTNYTPTTFTYPFGAISKDSVDVIKQLGFKATLSCTEGINKISNNPECLYGLKRFNRSNKYSTNSFFEKIEILY